MATEMAGKKRGLGRGLEALLGTEEVATDKTRLDEIPLEWIKPGKYQPRKEFSSESLEELAASIKAQGVMQPIVLRALADQQYEIIAGERRWRAAQRAGLERIPAVVREADDEATIALSLIENLQREDLNPMEEAQALQRLVSEFNLTHQQVADALGKSRVAVTNSLRLNNLSADVIRLLTNGDIEMGHARALLTLPDEVQLSLAQEVVNKQLNVRQTEALVKTTLADKPPPPAKKLDADTRHLQDRLSARFGQPVQIQHSARGKGKLIISYSSLDELDGILDQFGDLE
jgi:ParB family transcriptional regulator, chromosome partitioning protein